MGFLIVVGVCLIVYIALGIVYFQQGSKQKELDVQIAQLNTVLSKSLPSAEKLRADYEAANHSLAPLTVPAVLDVIVKIAQDSGIDVASENDKFNIPPPGEPLKQKMGGGTYLVLAVRNIRVQGSGASVMKFVSSIDSGSTLKTMILKNVDLAYDTKTAGGEAGEIQASVDVDIYFKSTGGS